MSRSPTTGSETGAAEPGKDAPGSAFSDASARITTWRFAGYSPDTVLGVRFDTTSYAVFVADSLPDAQRDLVFEELGP